MGLRVDRVVCASGSARTYAGLLAGFWGTRGGIPVVGMNVSQTKAQQEELVFKLARETAALAGIDGGPPRDAVVCFGDYVGTGSSIRFVRDFSRRARTWSLCTSAARRRCMRTLDVSANRTSYLHQLYHHQRDVILLGRFPAKTLNRFDDGGLDACG